ncbi:PRC-barrel domain-containing protein [Marivita sp.]|jgi:hypothetical protein|uniref:PRC-barrel domain-containing protein n=1 Tax=Marivita sp. TaxID=2003365 RepID=UPI003F71230C
MKRFSIAATTTSALALASPAIAQDAQDNQDTAEGSSVEVLSSWTYDQLYAEGWSVEDMFATTDVVDTSGETIGDVENVIFGTNGEMLGLIAEVGGFWDIGDTHVHVPWSEASMTDGIEQIQVPVTEDTVDEYGIFGGYSGDGQLTQEDTSDTSAVDDDVMAGPDVFKATDLIGDYAYLSDDVRYGYVADIIVQDASISAIVSDARAYGSGGYYAYPYSENRVSPMRSPRYDMPYDDAAIDTLENFDYDQLQSRVR